MNIQTLYIDSSEEITAVIERLKGSHEPIIALVVPKGGALIQSIVNLKLIRRAAQDAAKDVILVTTDKIGRNLATQVGIPVAASEKEVASVANGTAAPADEQVNVIAGVRIHRYYNEDGEAEEKPTSEPQVSTTPGATVIVPKTLMQVEKATVPMEVEPAAVPAVIEPPIASETVFEQPEIGPVIPPAVETVNPTSNLSDTPADTTIKRTVIDLNTVATQEVNKPPVERVPNNQRNKLLPVFAAILLVVLALGAVSALFLPKVTVVLTVQAQAISQDVLITAETDVSTPNGTTIPAEKIHADVTDTVTFNATGTKDEGTQATGTATLYNYTSTSPQTVPSGTVVTASGQTFTTQQNVSVPGYTQAGLGKPLVPGTATVPVTAVNAGTDSNLSSAPITGNVGNNNNLSGKIDSSGGTSKTVNALSDTDIANAKTALEAQLQTDLVKKVTDQLAKRDVKTADGADTYSTPTFTTSQPSGTVTDTAQATITGSLDRIIVDSAKAEAAATAKVETQTVANETQILNPATITATTFDSSTSSLHVTVHITGKNTPVFTTTNIPSQIQGKSLANASDLIKSLTPAQTVTFTLSPSWWPIKHLPTFSKYITVQTVYE